MPDNWIYYLLAMALVGAIRPFFWLLVLTPLLWIGYRVLPNRAGEILFGHYWKKSGSVKLVQETHPSDSD